MTRTALLGAAAMSAQGNAQSETQGALNEQNGIALEHEHEAGAVGLDGCNLDIATVVTVAR